MKTTMKKIAASLLVMLLVFQMLPAMADETTTVSNLQPPITSYREKLEIQAITETLKVNMELQLSATDKYNNLQWTSDDETIATVDQNGLVTTLAPGTVKITAAEGEYRDTITLRVVGDKPAAEDNGGETTEEPSDEGDTPKEKMIIIITGSKDKETYNGQEYRTTYNAYSNNPDFDANKLHLINEGSLAAGTIPGVYQDTLTESDFEYEGQDVELVITNGWLQIKPAQLTIVVDDQTMYEGGAQPELTATVTGLVPGDDPSQIIYELKTVTSNGTTRITAEYEALQGNYRITDVVDGEMTVIKAQPLYNIAKIGDKYYRLAKTQIWTEWKLENPNFGKVLTTDQYVADPYDFTELTITVNGKDYLYNCKENAEAILKGANYYDIKSVKLTIIKEKIGAMDGNNPRWAVPEDQRYDDPNKTNSYHRDYELTLHEGKVTVTEQRAYNFLSVDISNNPNNYYRLPTTTITAKQLSKYSNGIIPEGEYILERYNFSGTVITIDGVEYKYNDGSMTEYDNYFTVSFVEVQKVDMFNRDNSWFNNQEGWLDGAYEEYGSLPNKTVAYHANYKAVTHKAAERAKSVTITTSHTGATGYLGDRITLTAHLTGFDGLTEGVDYKLVWQYTVDRNEWKDIPNAKGTTYTFTLNETTTRYTWRVVAIDLE